MSELSKNKKFAPASVVAVMCTPISKPLLLQKRVLHGISAVFKDVMPGLSGLTPPKRSHSAGIYAFLKPGAKTAEIFASY